MAQLHMVFSVLRTGLSLDSQWYFEHFSVVKGRLGFFFQEVVP